MGNIVAIILFVLSLPIFIIFIPFWLLLQIGCLIEKKWLPKTPEYPTPKTVEDIYRERWQTNYWKPGNHIYDHYMDKK